MDAPFLVYLAAIRPGHNPHRYEHTHPFDELVHIVGGTGYQLEAGHQHPCADGDVFYFPAGVAHNSWPGTGSGFGCEVFWHSDAAYQEENPCDREALSALARLREHARQDPRLPIARSEARRIFAAAMDEGQARRPGCNAVLKALHTRLLIAAARNPQLQARTPLEHPRGDDQMAAVLAWMAANHALPIAVDDALRVSHLGRSRFHECFRAATGTTFVAHLTDLRCRAAAELLRISSHSISTIASRCGFRDPARFSRVFKEWAGTSPRSYRRGNAPSPPA